MLRMILVLPFLLLFVGCKDKEPEMSIGNFQSQIAKINSLNQNVETKRTELYSLIREFNSTRPEAEQFDITSLDTLMGAPEKELLKAMFREEKDISYTGLLKNILEKNDQIAQLGGQIAELERKMPAPYQVKNGDTHFKVVLDYLMLHHGMTYKEAFNTAWKTALVDELLPGNQIWLAYHDGVLASYVTQGDAKIAPMTMHLMARKKMLG